MIPAHEIATLLRAAAHGEVPVVVDDCRPWKTIYCGDVSLMLGAWHVVIFNDRDTLDYVDHARAPDGRTGDYDDWAAAVDPLDMLTPAEYSQLLGVVRAAPLMPAADA